jgi:hypothetical protein
MSFKNQKEYEKEKQKWLSSRLRNMSPAGYDAFLRDESAFLSAQDAVKNNSAATGGKGAKGANGMQIRGTAGSAYSGNSMTIDAGDAQFVDFGTVFSDKDLTDPGTKFAKKGTFKDYLANIQGKHFDKDGNLVVPKFDMPDRVKLSDEQKAANQAIDSQFDNNGFLKIKDVKNPKLDKLKTKKSYRKAGNKLARRLGIDDIEKRNNGKRILRSQANMYDAKTKSLNIPDFSLGGNLGKNMKKIGSQYTDLSGIRS